MGAATGPLNGVRTPRLMILFSLSIPGPSLTPPLVLLAADAQPESTSARTDRIKKTRAKNVVLVAIAIPPEECWNYCHASGDHVPSRSVSCPRVRHCAAARFKSHYP